DVSIAFDFDDQNGKGEQDAISLAQAAHAHNVKAMLMLGGAGNGRPIANAASSANLSTFVTNLVNALNTLGYDGIDLDWEDSLNVDDLVSLAQALRAAKSNILLTYPGGTLNPNFQSVDSRMVTLAKSLDRFMIQSYFPDTAVAGSGWLSWFNSPLSGSQGST